MGPGIQHKETGMRVASAMVRSLGLALLLVAVALLAGCSGKKGGGQSGAGAGQPVTITVWEQMDPPERVQFEKHIAEYQSSHPGITVQHQNYDTEALRKQFQTAASGGAGPELVFGPSDQVGPFSVMGIIQPLEKVEGLGPEYFARFDAGSLDTLDGHLYYAPDQMGNHLVLIYNRKFAPTPPQTTDELIAQSRKLTVKGDGSPGSARYGFTLNMVEPFWLVPFLSGYGGWVMDSKYQPTLDTPAMAKALQLLADLRDVHQVMPRECNYQVMETLFKEGKSVFLVNGPWSWQGYREAGGDFGIAPLPKVVATGRWCAPMTASKGYSISKNCPPEKLAAVVDLLRYLTDTPIEVDNARVLRTLPSVKAAYDDPVVRDDAFLKSSRQAYDLGRRMPVVPEMRAIWDAMRPEMEKVLNGQEKPAAAAQAMQAAAVKQIKLMKE
jgi:arabinogalactan oligomer / maltooligosaccharide transport system permease protein